MKYKVRYFPSGPLAKTLCSQCWGPEFDPWLGNQIPQATAKRSCMMQQRLKIPRATVKTRHGEVGGRFKREGTQAYLWLIHVDVWQKPAQYCKVIILQLKKMKAKEQISGQMRQQILYKSSPASFFLGRQDTDLLAESQEKGKGLNGVKEDRKMCNSYLRKQVKDQSREMPQNPGAGLRAPMESRVISWLCI